MLLNRANKCFYTTIICLATFTLFAGDDPCTATNLSTSNTEFLLFDNSGNSDSGVETPPLGGYLGPDTWFTFTMTSFELTLLIEEGGMTDPAIAIYGGDCDDPIVYYNVSDNNCTGGVSPQLLFDDLTPGEQYYIRVWPQDGSPNGNFGIFLGTVLPTLLDFTTFADASIIEECIELTQEQGNQQGCAWYQVEIDFSQPFTHEMLANFGDKDPSGADGICLVYQSNGPDFCGGTGEGIGAAGMPNSAIFEFDTWQNNNLGDPAEDHASFNINGNMAHPASINGPITLGNIEDGVDHNITFNWDPSGNSYELFFDGNLILSGSYDIINNCFGGSSLAYWGYTASTGGSNNNQIICPIVVEYNPATVSYEEVTICAGESYNGWTESGFYISEEPGSNGCTHQTHTRLTIIEESDPYLLQKYICDGEIFALEGEVFTNEGIYTIYTETELGCDSTIILDLKVIISTLDILGNDEFTCLIDSITLTIEFDLNYPISDVDFFWQTPNGTLQSDSIIATTPGWYSVNAFIYYEDALCIVSAETQLYIDNIPPIIDDISDLTILCNTPIDERILVAPENPNSLDFNWYLDNILIGTNNILPVSIEGIYTLEAQDTTNGCITTIDANVFIDDDIPQIEIGYDSLILNCQSIEFVLDPTIFYQGPGNIVWDYNSIFLSNDTTITVNEPGVYTISITDANDCTAIDSILLSIDTLAPELILEDIIIPCDQTDTLINPITLSINTVADWESPQILNNEITPLINTAGTYSITLTDTTNYCTASGNMIVELLGPSPDISISGDDTLDCIIELAEIIATTNQNDIIFNWFNSVSFLSNEPIINVNTPDIYIVQAFSPTGCSTLDSFEVIEHKIYPTITLESDTIDCDNLQATINAGIINGTIENWVTPDNNDPTSSTIVTDIIGFYTLNTINIETGCTTTDSIEVIDMSNPPVYTFESNTITCSQPNAILNLDISSNYQSVTWTYPNATSSSELSPEVTIPGNYLLHIEVEGSCDLDTIIEIEIDTISPSYQVEFGIIDCYNEQTNLNLNNVNNTESIIITSPSNLVFANIENTVTESGIYSINTIGSNGCVTNSNIEILSLISIPEVTIEQDVLVSCNAPNATITANSNNDNIGYTWSNDLSNTIGNSNTITVSSGGVFSLYIIDENGCENVYTVNIEEQLELPEINLIADNITCNNSMATITLESQSELTDVIWSDANEVVSTDNQLVVDQGGWYYVQGSNQYGCEAEDSILVLENITAPVLVLLSPDTIKLLPNGFYDILIDEFSSGNLDYSWMPTEGLSCSDCLEPTITEYLHDSYQLTVTNDYGCITTITIHIREKKLTSVNIPNIFSPSSRDGYNDYFTLYGNENVILINEMYVYDRWGNLVYSNNNFLPNDPYQGWDGLFNGESVVNGVYVYLFKVTTNEGQILTFAGDITKI